MAGEVACIPADCTQTSDGKAYGTPSNGWQGAGWPVTNTLVIPDDWVSGYYVARAELRAGDQDGRSTAVLFVVRQKPERRAQIPRPRAGEHVAGLQPLGRQEPLRHQQRGRPCEPGLLRAAPFGWTTSRPGSGEIQLVRFLEREGYDVAYQTDVDTHRDPASLERHRLVVVDGHDEYWTRATRTAFDAARDAGTNLAFIGANIGYWRISYEDGERTIAVDKAPTDLFRRLTPPAPECELLGVQYEGGQRASGDPPRDYRVAAPDDAWLRGTGLSVLPELVGPEWDTRLCGQPGATVLFHYAGAPANVRCGALHRSNVWRTGLQRRLSSVRVGPRRLGAADTRLRLSSHPRPAAVHAQRPGRPDTARPPASGGRAAGAPERGAARDTDRRQSARGRFPRRPGRVQNTWRCLRGGRAPWTPHVRLSGGGG